MRHPTTLFGPLALVLLALLLSVVPLCLVSQPFQQCQAHVERAEAQQAENDYPQAIFARVRCVGIAVNANNGAITALATIVMAVFSILLYQATQRTNETAENSNRVATRAARAAKRSADSLRAAERAWVMQHEVRAVFNEFENDGEKFVKFVAYLDLKNHGRTPAILRMFTMQLSVEDAATNFRPSAVENDSPDLSMDEALGAGEIRKAEDKAFGEELTVLSIADWKAIKNYRKGFFLVALIEYRDVFNLNRETHVCMGYMPDGNRFAVSGNGRNDIT
jgi:hypothetical protein